MDKNNVLADHNITLVYVLRNMPWKEVCTSDVFIIGYIFQCVWWGILLGLFVYYL